MAQNALNYTLGAVDKIAGKKTAAQLEGLMGSKSFALSEGALYIDNRY